MTKRQLKEIIQEVIIEQLIIENTAYKVLKKVVNGEYDRNTIEMGDWKVDMVYDYDLNLDIYFDNVHIISYIMSGNNKLQSLDLYNKDEYKKEIKSSLNALVKLGYPIK